LFKRNKDIVESIRKDRGIMIFRQKDGTLLEIKKADFTNDVRYYKKIKELKLALFFPKADNIEKKSSYSRDCIQKLLL
jgi:hypothetical protein